MAARRGRGGRGRLGLAAACVVLAIDAAAAPPPSPPAPPAPPAPAPARGPQPFGSGLGGARLGCSATPALGGLGGGGALLDVQYYSYAVSGACAASLLANSTAACVAPPPPVDASPAPVGCAAYAAPDGSPITDVLGTCPWCAQPWASLGDGTCKCVGGCCLDAAGCAAAPPPSPPAPYGGVEYGGGPVLSVPPLDLYVLFVGAPAGAVRATITSLVNGLGFSDYWGVTAAYYQLGDGGALAGVTQDVRLAATASVSIAANASVNPAAQVEAAFVSGAFPPSPAAAYAVVTSPDAQVELFCTEACSYHGYFTYPVTGDVIKWLWVGDARTQCAAACNPANLTDATAPSGDAAADAMASNFAHELAETAADPLLNAWNATGAPPPAGVPVGAVFEPIGDACEGQYGVVSRTAAGALYNVRLSTGIFLLQELWDPRDGGGCAQDADHGVWPPPSPPPPHWTVPAGAPPPPAPPVPPLPARAAGAGEERALSTPLALPAPGAMPGIAFTVSSNQRVLLQALETQFSVAAPATARAYWTAAKLDANGTLSSLQNWSELTGAGGVNVTRSGLRAVPFAAPVLLEADASLTLYLTVDAPAAGMGVLAQNLGTATFVENAATDGWLTLSGARTGGYPLGAGGAWSADRFLFSGTLVYQWAPAPPPVPPPPAPPPPPVLTGVYGNLTLVGLGVGQLNAATRAAVAAALGRLTGTTAAVLSVAQSAPDRVTVAFSIGSAATGVAASAASALVALNSTQLVSGLGLAGVLGAAAAVAAAPPAVLPSAPAVASVVGGALHSGTQQVNPFVCAQPSARVVVNASHVAILLSYATAAGVAAVPFGRTPFVFATFSNVGAQAALPWDPSSDPTDANPFGARNPAVGSAFARYRALDASLYAGMCDPAAAAAAPYGTSSYAPAGNTPPAYPFAGNLTQQAPLDIPLNDGADTPALVGLTAQAAGCACVAAAQQPDGSFALPGGACAAYASGSPSAQFFRAGSWALRQGVNASAGLCALQTTALFVRTMSEFRALSFVLSAQSTNSLRVSWTLFSAEVGSSSLWAPAARVVDSLQKRVVSMPMAFELFEDGAVAVTLNSNQLLAPVLSTVAYQSAVASAGAGAGADATVRMVLYVAQPANGSVLMDATAMAALAPAAADGSGADCGDYAAAGAAGAFPAVTGYACLLAGCATMTNAQLPSGLAPATTGAASTWLPYAFTLTCHFPVAAGGAIRSDLRVAYALANGAGAPLTDASAQPYVALTLSSVPVVAAGTAATDFPLEARLLQLREATLANASTLSDVAYANEGNPSLDAQPSIAWSEAFAVQFQLSNVADRAAYQVTPRLIMLVATNSTEASNGTTWTPLGGADGGSLGGDWCGVSGALAALSVPMPTSPLAWGADLAAAVGGPHVVAALAALYADHLSADVATLQGDIAPAGAPAVATVADSSGGLLLPLRNRLQVNGVQGYQLRVCAVLSADEYAAFAGGGYYPLYATAGAAAANSQRPDLPATRVTVNGLAAFLPAAAPLLCAPDAAAAALGAAAASSAACVAALASAPAAPGGARRRALLAVQTALASATEAPWVFMQPQVQAGPQSPVDLAPESAQQSRTQQLAGGPGAGPAPPPQQSAPSPSSSNHTGAIVGGVVGGVAALAALAAGAALAWRRAARRRAAPALPTRDGARARFGARRTRAPITL